MTQTAGNMTAADVRRRVRQVAGAATEGDFEFAHSLEAGLHQDVLRAIAAGAENPVGLAKAALRTRKIDFQRVTA